jgi:MFS family permease
MRARLSLLMFLQYAPQGAFVPLFSLRLQELGFTHVEIGWACATQALAALVAPLVAGQVADRWFPAQRCLAVCAVLAGLILWLLAGLTSWPAVFAASLAFWLVMGPVNTLGTALSFAHLVDPARDFGGVRLWGTIGWATAPGWRRWPPCACCAAGPLPHSGPAPSACA